LGSKEGADERGVNGLACGGLACAPELRVGLSLA
jgi:hypothetical protein